MADIQQKMKTGYTVLRVVILSLLLLAAVIWLLMKLLTDEDKKCPSKIPYPAAHAFCRVLTQFDTSRSGHISVADLAKALEVGSSKENESGFGLTRFLSTSHQASCKSQLGGRFSFSSNGVDPTEFSKELFKEINVLHTGRAPIGLLSLAVAGWPDRATSSRISRQFFEEDSLFEMSTAGEIQRLDRGINNTAD